MPNKSTIWSALLLTLLVCFLIAKNFINCIPQDYPYYIVTDYAVRFAIIAPCLALVWLGFCTLSSANIQLPKLTLLLRSIFIYGLASISFTAIDRIIYTSLYPNVVFSKIYAAYPLMRNIDLTFGLLLVSISEELCFRGILLCTLRKVTDKMVTICIISSILFSVWHFSRGPHTMIISLAFGVIYFSSNLQSKSLIPSITLHSLTNLYYWNL